jgi:hypothetical protein
VAAETFKLKMNKLLNQSGARPRCRSRREALSRRAASGRRRSPDLRGYRNGEKSQQGPLLAPRCRARCGGLQRPDGASPRPLRAGSLGRNMGNSAGVIGLYFAAFETLLFGQVDGAVPDEAVTVAAGGQRCAGAAQASRRSGRAAASSRSARQHGAPRASAPDPALHLVVPRCLACAGWRGQGQARSRVC